MSPAASRGVASWCSDPRSVSLGRTGLGFVGAGAGLAGMRWDRRASWLGNGAVLSAVQVGADGIDHTSEGCDFSQYG